MSYRHSSYRKLAKALDRANNPASGESVQLSRSEMNRVLHWSRQGPLPKGPQWGRPKAAR